MRANERTMGPSASSRASRAMPSLWPSCSTVRGATGSTCHAGPRQHCCWWPLRRPHTHTHIHVRCACAGDTHMHTCTPARARCACAGLLLHRRTHARATGLEMCTCKAAGVCGPCVSTHTCTQNLAHMLIKRTVCSHPMYTPPVLAVPRQAVTLAVVPTACVAHAPAAGNAAAPRFAKLPCALSFIHHAASLCVCVCVCVC